VPALIDHPGMVGGRVGRSIGLSCAASLSLLAALFTASAGCGGGGGDGLNIGSGGEVSCTVSESSLTDGGLPLQVCEEASGLTAQQAQQFQQQCAPTGTTSGGASAHFAAAPCSRNHALGGCRITAGGITETGWYYDDGSGLQTSADIQSLCASAGATFIPPSG
jgi:hypothetical protein